MMSYFGKCIHVSRSQGSFKKQNLVNKITFFRNTKQVLSIFPEATRSRSGRIEPEQTSYGVGEIMEHLSNIKVLCLYLRGSSQGSYSNFPKRGEKFHATLEEISPQSNLTGRKRQKDLSLQVINHLKGMEDSYFAHRP